MNETTTQQQTYLLETTATQRQMDYRKELEAMFNDSPLPKDDLLFNLGLYTRGSLLVKYVVMSDLYKKILNIPGNIFEFGVWWGQNLVLMENLRAIYEPFNKQRRIIGFDTFSGYTKPSAVDSNSDAWQENSYSTSTSYKAYLQKLLAIHEGNNVLGHIQNNHELVEGDVTKTAPKYFSDRPETIVALAYFDMGLYEPTKAALEALLPHTVPGSVILFDELTWREAPGEAVAFFEVMKGRKFEIEKCQQFPSKSIVTLL